MLSYILSFCLLFAFIFIKIDTGFAEIMKQ